MVNVDGIDSSDIDSEKIIIIIKDSSDIELNIGEQLVLPPLLSICVLVKWY